MGLILHGRERFGLRNLTHIRIDAAIIGMWEHGGHGRPRFQVLVIGRFAAFAALN
jgi:hypothetical protein